MDISIKKALSGSYKNSNWDKDGYYVYMLCSKTTNKPFYIGKGKDDRLYAHENGTKKFEQLIKEEIEAEIKSNGDDLSEKEVKDMVKSKMKSNKFKKILSMLETEDYEPAIIKYGLTENESYMAESALINMYNYIETEPLTNIVNGHMSKREKYNRSRKTQALNLKDFKNECAIEEIEVSSIKANIAFIKINNMYQYCKNERDMEKAIYYVTQGFWNIAEKNFKKIDYIFSLYQSQVVGIYPVRKESWKRRIEIGKISIKNSCATYANGISLPSFPFDTRCREYYWHNKSVEACWDYDKLMKLLSCEEEKEFKATQLKNEKNTKIDGKKCIVPKKEEDYKKSYKDWANKCFFTANYKSKSGEYEKIKSQYLGKLLIGGKKTSQNPVTYNF
ncbi:MAG: hypothetical protein E7389_01285 [Ruminococcaceae bacterium]|nr:hypothetical protein [Oscillospiraceae bacterium]